MLHLSTRAVLTCIKRIASGIGQASSALACRCAPLHCADLSYGRERVSELHYALSSSFVFILLLLIWRCPLYFQFIEMEVCPRNLCMLTVLYALLLRQHLVSPHRGIKFARFLLWYSSVFGILELVTWHFLINKVC